MKKLLALLVLVPQFAWGAHDFNGTTADYAESATAELTATTITLCGWGKSDDATVGQAVITLDNSGAVGSDQFSLRFEGAVAGDPMGALTQQTTAGTFGRAVSSTGYSTGVWHAGCATFTSTTSRAAYIDGGSKGTEATSVSPAGINATLVGARYNAGARINPFNGSLAEVGLWNVALTDDEVATLAKGYAPPCVRRASLLAYYPMVRDTTSLKDLFSATANNLTLAGTTAVADHPRVINCQ